MLAFIMAQAGSNVGQTAGKNVYDVVAGFGWWIALAILIVGALGHIGGKQVQRMLVLFGLFGLIVIPLLAPSGFKGMMQEWANTVTSGFPKG